MNSTLFLVTLIGCLLNQVICDTESTSNLNGLYDQQSKAWNQAFLKNLDNLQDQQINYNQLDQLMSDLSTPGFYICRQSYHNIYQPIAPLNTMNDLTR